MLRPVLVHLGLIDPDETKAPNASIILDGDAVGRVKSFMSDAVNQDEAFNVLGIGRGPRASLLDGAFPAPALQTGEKGEGWVLYRREDLDRWIERLQGGAPLVDAPPDGSVDIVEAGARAQRSSGEIVKALMNGRLSATARLRGAPPFMSIMVDVESAKNLFRSALRRDDMMTVAEAVKVLAATHYVVVALMEGGHLPATRAPAVGSRRMRIDLARRDVAEFAERYISSKQAAAHVGLHSRTIRERLSREGILPAIDLPEFPASFYYRREEIMRFPAGCFAGGR